MKYISNAFSIQMLRNPHSLITVHELAYDEFKALSYGAYSCVGHLDLAQLINVKYNRESIKLNPGDVLYVAQTWGGRLPEGTKKLPGDVELRFYCVKILDNLDMQFEGVNAVCTGD